MPYQITWESEGALSCFNGMINPQLHIEALNALFGDSRMDDIKYIIGDFSQIDECLLGKHDIEYPLAMTTGASSYIKNMKIALIAVDNKIIDLCQNYIKVLSSLNTSWEVILFDDIDVARNWISSYTFKKRFVVAK